MSPSLKFELDLWQKGYRYLVGIDEVGRGSWAGPLVAAGVILPHDFQIPVNLNDSKMLKPSQRVLLAKVIEKLAISYSIAEISARVIDKMGIAKATNLAFKKVVKGLNPQPDFCLIDAFYIKYFPRKKQLALKNGDKLCATIAAASIIAKVHRDKIMRKLHFRFPGYGFGKHKGYGTRLHQEAIKNFGFCQIHRMSYRLDFLTK